MAGGGEPGIRTLLISHYTTYTYEQPVERSSHRLLLRPVEDRNQDLVDFALNLQPPVGWIEYEDVFGNAAFAVEINAPFNQREISSRATVRIRPAPPLEQRAVHRRHAIPLN